MMDRRRGPLTTLRYKNEGAALNGPSSHAPHARQRTTRAHASARTDRPWCPPPAV